jgi:hypothetical protein
MANNKNKMFLFITIDVMKHIWLLQVYTSIPACQSIAKTALDLEIFGCVASFLQFWMIFESLQKTLE